MYVRFLFDCLNEGEKAEGVVRVRERDMGVREALVGVCVVGDCIIGEGWTTGGAVVVGVIKIVCVAIVVSVVGFVGGMLVHVRECDSGVCRLTADIGSPLVGVVRYMTIDPYVDGHLLGSLYVDRLWCTRVKHELGSEGTQVPY